MSTKHVASCDCGWTSNPRRFPHVDTRGDDNACDALWLAAIGAHLTGAPVLDLPVTHRDALARITPPKEWKP